MRLGQELQGKEARQERCGRVSHAMWGLALWGMMRNLRFDYAMKGKLRLSKIGETLADFGM